MSGGIVTSSSGLTPVIPHSGTDKINYNSGSESIIDSERSISAEFLNRQSGDFYDETMPLSTAI